MQDLFFKGKVYKHPAVHAQGGGVELVYGNVVASPMPAKSKLYSQIENLAKSSVTTRIRKWLKAFKSVFALNTIEFKIIQNEIQELLISYNYESPFVFEIGLLDPVTSQFKEKENRSLTVGYLTSFVIVVCSNKNNFTTASEEKCNETPTLDFCIEHSVDLIIKANPLYRGIHTTTVSEYLIGVNRHVWHTVDPPSIMKERVSISPVQESKSESTGIKLRTVTYNIWHHNPAQWVYSNPLERWKKYTERMRYLADVIIREDPDIIFLQEVRIDTNFRGFDEIGIQVNTCNSDDTFSRSFCTQCEEALSCDESDSLDPDIGKIGSQLEHLLFFLKEAHDRHNQNSMCRNSSDGISFNKTVHQHCLFGYQAIYQPAMHMQNKNMFSVAPNEAEGLAILVRGFPKNGIYFEVINTSYVLLPRHLGDTDDTHQRLLLHAEVRIRQFNVGRLDCSISNDTKQSSQENIVFDVYTAHLSLSEKARNTSVQTIWKYAKEGRGDFGIFAGDLNAEPDECAVLYLNRADIDLDKNCKSDFIEAGEGLPDFVDAWSAQYSNPPIAENHLETEHDRVRKTRLSGLTFPVDKPVKRIDFVFVRNSTIFTSDTELGTNNYKVYSLY